MKKKKTNRRAKKRRKTSIMKYAGAWGDRKEIDEIFRKILKRKSNRKPVEF